MRHARATRAPLALTPPPPAASGSRAQRLDADAPFGAGPEAVRAAVEHLGYVQIDTINVIERSHHHILWTRIPAYRRADLAAALGVDKSVFEYWAHALAYIPTRDYRFFLPDMAAPPRESLGLVRLRHARPTCAGWSPGSGATAPLSIRDIDDDELVEKDHPWASRKPVEARAAARLLRRPADDQRPRRHGEDLRADRPPFRLAAAPARRAPRRRCSTTCSTARCAPRASSASTRICYMDAPRKPAMAALIEARVRRRRLVPVAIEGASGRTGRRRRRSRRCRCPSRSSSTSLSPFDPLVIQRKRLALFFGYDHRFEAYVPKPKRVLGYFALPVLVGDRVAAAIDLKADRATRRAADPAVDLDRRPAAATRRASRRRSAASRRSSSAT